MESITTRRSFTWLSGLITIFLAAFLVVIHIRFYQYAFDDAYIHFRVARSLVETGTPYFNAHEIVKVSTSSGWTVFLALLFGIARLIKMDNHFPLFIAVLNALFSFCGMLAYTKVVEALLPKPAPLPMKMLFQVLYVVLLLPSSIGLMETPFALLIAGVGIYFLLQSKPSGFAFLGFAPYIRLELLILLGLAGVFTALRRQFKLQHILGYIAMGFIPLLVYDLYFFHTVIPHSIVAKSVVYSLELLQPAVFIVFFSLPPIPFKNMLINLGVGTTIFSMVFITTVTALKERKGLNRFWPFVFCIWSLLVAGGYILGRAYIFDWYTPLYTIPILLACFVCSISTNQSRNIILRGLLCVPFLVSAVSVTRVLYAGIDNPGVFYLFDAGSRVKVYLKIGAILNAEYPQATLLTSEIGGLGYSFRGRILDAAGLASPGALAFHPMKVPEQRLSGGIGAIPPEYVKANNPDLIVSYDFFAQALLKDAVIQQYNVILIPAYLPEDAIYSESKTMWGSKYLRVYIRKDLPVSDEILALGQ
jgi:hypothetical protein